MPRSRYEIVVRGRLGPRFEGLLDGFEVSGVEQGETHLIGRAEDQAALQGALRKPSDFGLGLLSVTASLP
jgi:hypothetical protein